MPKATKCNLNGHEIDVAEALAIRERDPNVVFHCTECDQRVRAHKLGTTGQAAHFEHLAANEGCSLSGRR